MNMNLLRGKMLRMIILAAASVFAMALLSPAAAGGEITSFAVAPYSGCSSDDDLVYWHAAEEKDTHYLFLPAWTDPGSAKVYYTADETVMLDDAALLSGEASPGLTAGEHILTCGEKVYPLYVGISENIPAVFIVTRSGSLDYIHEDPQNREEAAIRVYEGGRLYLDQYLSQIKIRGNWTLKPDKKAYTVKFRKETDLLGMGKAKKWTLLANYVDRSLLRNVWGWEFAKAFGLRYSSDYRHVDLYLNGDYAGNYLACDKVEAGPGRVEIRDLSKENERVNRGIDLNNLPQAGTGENGLVQTNEVYGSAKWIELPNEPEDITGGYLLEFELRDRYDSELCGFVTENGNPIVIKEPEIAGEKEVRYIREIVDEAMRALCSADGFNEKGKHYSEYFDMDSFSSMYILQELGSNYDAGQTSLFMVKAGADEKLVFSPVWDMDNAFGSHAARAYETNLSNPDIWWANSMGNNVSTIMTQAYKHEDFRETVREKWSRFLEEGIFDRVFEKVHALSEKLTVTTDMNLLRWEANVNPSNVEATRKWWIDNSENFVRDRVKGLSRGFLGDTAMLYYDSNGGSGHVYQRMILLQGETAVIGDHVQGWNAVLPPAEEYRFAGWNTLPDGSGDMYQPGDELVLNAPTTVLYAIWEK